MLKYRRQLGGWSGRVNLPQVSGLSCAAVGQDRNMNQKQGVVVVSIVVSDVDCRGYAYARRVAQLA